ncbi:MAG: hypothetical protein FWC41_06715 [Firmicutes bacterium]|nr:hypothetical protein [Bacillota bacterium]
MLITGIRHAISTELDTRRSSIFMRYLYQYLEMFAFLGIILPIVIGVDYFCVSKLKDVTVTNKYYQVMDNLNQIEYYFYTDSYRFLSDVIFYENTKISDKITLHRTPIFHTVTCVTSSSDQLVYMCKPTNVYGWPFIIVALTFICSIIFIIKTWGWMRNSEFIKYDSMINMGIINAILCIFIIVAVLCHIPN